MSESGIYTIYCKANGMYYIGRSTDVTRRWWQHLNHLQKKKHDNKLLQRNYDKYGEDGLSFNVLLTCPHSELILIEQDLLDGHFHDPNCMNLTQNASDGYLPGHSHSESTRRKMSEFRKNDPATKEQLAKFHRQQSHEVLAVNIKTGEERLLPSLNETARQFKVTAHTIRSYCKGFFPQPSVRRIGGASSNVPKHLSEWEFHYA